MQANWISESGKPFYLDNVVSVYNYKGLNKVLNTPQIETIKSKSFIGVWKIKKLKQNNFTNG